MKTSLTFLCLIATFTRLFAGEAGLIETFQPLEGFESGHPIVVPVMCYAQNTHVGWHQAVRYIAAKYVPPAIGTKSVGDINVASRCHLFVWASDGADGRITITLDFTALKMPPRLGYTESEVVVATLECLRRIAGDKLKNTPIETKYKPNGQEAIKDLVNAFLKHPKDTEFLSQ